MGIYSGSNIRRTARMFGTAALVAAPLFALLGLAGVLGLGSFGGTAPVEILSRHRPVAGRSCATASTATPSGGSRASTSRR